MIDDAEFIEGESEAKGTVLKFFEKLVGSQEVTQGFKVRLLLVGSGATENEVHSWDYDLDIDLNDFVESIIDHAVEDSAHYRSVIKYCVRCFIGGSPRRVVFKLNRPKTSSEEADEFGDDIETPTVRGAFQMSMRHTEFFAKESRHNAVLAVKATENIMRTYEQQIARLTKRVAELEERENNVRDIQFARDLHLEKIKREEDRKAEAYQVLRGVLPHLAQKFLGGGPPPAGTPGGPGPAPQGPDPLTDFLHQNAQGHGGAPPLDILHVRQDMILDSLFRTITSEQMQQLSSVMTPIQVASLVELHQIFQERQAAASPPPAPSPPQQTSSSPFGSSNGYGLEPRAER